MILRLDIHIPDSKINELEGLINQLTKMAGKVSGSGKPPSRRPGAKKKLNEMSKKELEAHFEAALNKKPAVRAAG